MTNEGLISKYKVLQILYESYGLRDAEKRIAELPIVSYSEKPNKCEDAISRQAVLDHIYGINGLEGFELSNVFEKHYADFIKSLPSVSTEKTGRWIYDRNNDDDGCEPYYCSECGTYSDDYPYCCGCGAKMVESQESEDKE